MQTAYIYDEVPLCASQFTGKERDNETGLDNFEERYFESNMGRFLSPDPEQTSGFLYPDDPQSWSGYAYARNNPLTMIDPDGMAYCTKGDNRTDAGSQEACEKDGGTWNHEAGDQQEVQNDSGDTDTVETPATEVTVEADPDTGAETVTFTNYYFMEREIPLTPEQRMIFTLAYQRSVHDLGCVGMGWAVQEGSHVASAPLFNKPFSAGGTSGTSAASKMSGGLKATKSVRTPVGIPGTGNFAMRRTVNLGRAAGRYLPYIGTAVGAGYAGYCLGQKP